MLTLQYYVEQFFLILFWPVVAIARYFRDRQKEKFALQLQLAQVSADAQKAVLVEFADVMKVTMKETAAASQEQAKVLQEWLAGFRTVEVPHSSTVTESDEARLEREKLRAMGFPIDLSGQEQLQWLAKEMEKVE